MHVSVPLPLCAVVVLRVDSSMTQITLSIISSEHSTRHSPQLFTEADEVVMQFVLQLFQARHRRHCCKRWVGGWVSERCILAFSVFTVAMLFAYNIWCILIIVYRQKMGFCNVVSEAHRAHRLNGWLFDSKVVIISTRWSQEKNEDDDTSFVAFSSFVTKIKTPCSSRQLWWAMKSFDEWILH